MNALTPRPRVPHTGRPLTADAYRKAPALAEHQQEFFPSRMPSKRTDEHGANVGPVMPERPVQQAWIRQMGPSPEQEETARAAADEDAMQRKAGKAVQSKVEEAIYSRYTNMMTAFKRIDLDNSGTITKEEIGRVLKLWGLPVDKDTLEGLMKTCDQNGDGVISYQEFVDGLVRETVALAAMGKHGMQPKEAMGVDEYEIWTDKAERRRKIRTDAKFVGEKERFKRIYGVDYDDMNDKD